MNQLQNALQDAVTSTATQDTVSAALAAGKRVLIVGTKAGNLPDWLRRHPQVAEWEAESASIVTAKKLPDGIGAVLFLRFLSHVNHRRIRDLAASAGAYAHPDLLGTGEVRRMLEPLRPAGQADDDDGERWEGSLFGLVEHHYEYGTERGHQARESERLLRLAHKLGITTTLMSVTSTVNLVHRGHDRERETEQRARYAPPMDVPELLQAPLDPGKVAHLAVVPPPAAAPQSIAALVATNTKSDEQVDHSIGELLRMIDDSIAVLGLAREQLVDLHTKNSALRSSREQLRAKMLSLFDGI